MATQVATDEDLADIWPCVWVAEGPMSRTAFFNIESAERWISERQQPALYKLTKYFPESVLAEIQQVSNGELQVADDDTEALQWINQRICRLKGNL